MRLNRDSAREDLRASSAYAREAYIQSQATLLEEARDEYRHMVYVLTE